ncbi:hypothetical protein BV25DRAFT_767909 [Artomyces pyxidatus]|uniref:Uncharacterized protein n=1 Tax=Artomyces pyxidatus TaxID=48021 RepID=A0ACB8SZB4_9AGAM|nr:hypothetical protein BV25DRAFT_767909 [Artomyces pyxidatus]
MLDGSRGPHTLATNDRLDRLRRHTAAWAQLRWTSRISLSHLKGCASSPRVSGDIVGLEYADDVINLSSLKVQRIPSELRAIDEHFVIHEAHQRPFVPSFCLDTAQDLVVFSRGVNMHHPEARIYLSSLLLEEPHPLAAAHGMIDLGPRTSGNLELRDVCGDSLLLTHRYGTFAPLVLNWKSGVYEAESPAIACGRWMFLDERHIFCFVHCKRDPPQPACLRVASLASAIPTAAVPASYEFALPEFLKHAVYNVCTHTTTFEIAHAPRGCFYPDPSDRLISVELFTDHRFRHSYILDVLASTLTRFIAAKPGLPGEAVVVPWDAWATRGARVTGMVDTSMSWTWMVSGSRRATLHSNCTVLTVLDYCPRRVARAISRGSATVLHGAEVSVQSTSAEFGPLRTLLPCIATEITLPESLALAGDGQLYAWICENGVVFAKCEGDWETIVDACAYTI